MLPPLLLVAVYNVDGRPRLVSTLVTAEAPDRATAAEYVVSKALDREDASRMMLVMYDHVKDKVSARCKLHVLDLQPPPEMDLFAKVVHGMTMIHGPVPDHPAYARAMFAGMAKLGEYAGHCTLP